ncbi:guanine deaminase [soil metagenome]
MSRSPEPGVTPRILRGALAHTPHDPFRHDGALESWHDGAVAIGADGRILDLGSAADVCERHPELPVQDERGGIILPGLVDAHVHYPQLPVVGAMGRTLLEWLEACTFPHEVRFARADFALEHAKSCLRLLAANGTTSAMVFGAHYAVAMEAFFVAALASRLRITSGLVVSDVLVPDALVTSPEIAYEESGLLARRWHGVGRLRYAVTPRFALSCSDELLAACGAVLRDAPHLSCTTHLNETRDEIEVVRGRFPGEDYLGVYERHGLVGPGTVFAHDLHPTESELARLARAGASVAHCASSNQFIGSGLFPMRRHLEAGVHVALGSDVGGGTGLSILKEGLVAYGGQMLLGAAGEPLTPARLLWLATAAGARALGRDDEVGDLTPGRAADLIVVRPPAGSTLAEVLPFAASLEEALGQLFTLAREDAILETVVGGERVHRRGSL